MSKNAEQVAIELKELMDDEEHTIMSWSDFYDIAERKKLRDAFYDAVTQEGLSIGIVVSFGNSGVHISTDE